MPKLNDNKKILAIAASGLVLCSAAGGGVWWASGLVEERQQAIDTASAEIADAERKISQIPNLEKDVVILRENVDAYSRILPDQGEVNEFLRTTNRFAFQAAVVLNDFLKGTPGKRGKYSSYSYRLEFEATLWQFMKFMNMFESHDRFIRVVKFSVKSAARDKVAKAFASGQDPVHKISLTVETFVYEGKNAGANVDIPGYARKREKYSQEILAGADAVGLERFDYVEEIGRRDILVDPRPTIGGPGLGDNPRALQKKTIDQFVERLAEARTLYESWKHVQDDYVTKESQARRLREVMTVLEQEAMLVSPKITNQALLAEWNGQVLAPMREIWRELRGGAEGVVPNALTEERLRAVLAEMRRAIQRGEYDGAIRLHDEIADLMMFEESDPRFSIAVQVQKTKEAVQTIVEFSELPMEVSGVVVFDEGRAGLLVNGKVYEEGDYLDDNLLLKTVGREQADFVFKGFVVRKKW